MLIQCPLRLTADTLADALHFADDIAATTSRDIEIDASPLRFVDPFGLSMLASSFEKAAARGHKVEVVALHPRFGGYLERMDLFRQPWIRCAVLPDHERADRRANLVELRNVKRRAEVDRTATALATALLGQIPGLEETAPRDEMTCRNDWDRTYEPLCHVFGELLENGLTHARRDGYTTVNTWVSAQYYRTVDEIRIGIVDSGCGILGSLGAHPKLSVRTHEAAILFALHPRVSCNREVGLNPMSANAGIGLTTVHRIVRQSGGRMQILSGNGLVKESGNTEGAQGHSGIRSWQGTAIAIEIPRQRLKSLNIRELMPPREFGRVPPPIRFE